MKDKKASVLSALICVKVSITTYKRKQREYIILLEVSQS